MGVIIERVTGQSWYDVVQKEVFDRAGMADTRTSVPFEEGKFAIGTTTVTSDLQGNIAGSPISALEVIPNKAKPSSNVWSTSGDLHRYMRALLDGELLSEEWSTKMLSPQRTTFELPKYGIKSWVGLGAQGEDLYGIVTVGHGGVVPGYSAAIEYLPENGWLLTVVSNTGEATGFLVFQRFLELAGHAPQ